MLNWKRMSDSDAKYINYTVSISQLKPLQSEQVDGNVMNYYKWEGQSIRIVYTPSNSYYVEEQA